MKNKILLSMVLACQVFAQTAGAADSDELEELQAEVERLRSVMPGQAFAMTQVAYNTSNLWFAAQAGNWPLAEFYLNETRVRLRWAMRVTPVRNISTGPLELTPIATALEENQLATLSTALASRDMAAFGSAYGNMLDACHACHVASEKGFLRLQIPTASAEPLIEFTAP